MKKILIPIIALLLLIGCQTNNDKGSSNTSGWAAGTQSPSENTLDSSESSDDSAKKTEPQSTLESAPKESDWTLDVDDTVDLDIEGIKISCSLTLKAVKRGGKTALGSYTGTATLKQKMNAEGLSKEMVAVAGGADTELQAKDVKIEIVGYNKEKYDAFGLSDSEVPLSILAAADSMALGSFTVNGSGNLNVQASAPFINDARAFSESGPGELTYKITVKGGQVFVSIPLLNLPESFKGMLIVVPRN